MLQYPIRVLLVEDDEDDYIIVLDNLCRVPGQKFKLDWVCTYPEAVVEVGKRNHDVYVFDYRLGPDNGVDLIREVIERGCTAPIVMLTRYTDRYIEIQARKAGAAGFLLKRDANPETLEKVIMGVLQEPALAAAVPGVAVSPAILAKSAESQPPAERLSE